MSESIANDNVLEDHVKTLETNVKNMLERRLAETGSSLFLLYCGCGCLP